MDDNPQATHYATIHDDYERHYYDDVSMAYRRRFMVETAFEELRLDGLRVAEIASGSGHNSAALKQLYPGVRLTGFDISAQACASYRDLVGEAVECDLTKPLTWQSDPFDLAFVFGGLHHCVIDLPMTLANVARLVRPGGIFIFIEPNASFALEAVRKAWYRVDRYFEAGTERALSHEELVAAAPGLFEPERLRFFGGPAYFLLLNSLLFRLPTSFKRGLSGPLMTLEALYDRIGRPAAHPAFAARWRRTEAAIPQLREETT